MSSFLRKVSLGIRQGVKILFKPIIFHLNKRGFGKTFYHNLYIDKEADVFKYFLEKYNINLIVDAGANAGQYASRIRKLGYNRKIISFEPTSIAYKQLTIKSDNDLNWDTYNFALGNKNEVREIALANATETSTLLSPSDLALEISDFYKTENHQTVTVKKLDECYKEWWKPTDNVWLKIDVEGYEYMLLEGATDFLRHVKAIELEINIANRYSGQTDYLTILNLLKSHGFNISTIFRIQRGIRNFLWVDADIILVKDAVQ